MVKLLFQNSGEKKKRQFPKLNDCLDKWFWAILSECVCVCPSLWTLLWCSWDTPDHNDRVCLPL